MEARFNAILRQNDSNQADSLDKIFDETISHANDSKSVATIVSFTQRLVQDDLPVQLSKAVVNQLAGKLIKTLSAEVFEDFCEKSLNTLKSSAGTFDEADYALRNKLFAIYVQWGQFSSAALALGALNVESVVRKYTDQEKADIYIKCAEAFLESEAHVDAEVFVNKASQYINNVTDIAINLRFKATFAKVLDSNRKFVEAAVRYHDLSRVTNANIDPDDLLELLAKAVTCAILGKTGAPRSRVMGLLAKDERLSSLDYLPKYSSHSIILNKMFREQILRKEELTIFETVLVDHQKARTTDGFTIFEKAIIEHNMLATGKIYNNIRINELASILLIDERRAEKVAAAMISEGRLQGRLDQVDHLLIFESAKSDEMSAVNFEISLVCDNVQAFVELVNA